MLTIFHKSFAIKPIVIGKVLWQTDIRNYPGSLRFSLLIVDSLKISNGDKVCFTFDNQKIFCGYIFSLTFTQNNIVNIVAYDQIRYLKNQDTSIYEDMTASQILQKICSEYNLKTGQIDHTSHIIPALISRNLSLLGIIQKALDIDEANTGKKYIIYDDFGKITLKNTENLLTSTVISEKNADSFNYTKEIDTDTYNQIKMTFGNIKKGYKEIVFKSGENSIKNWGILQYCGNADNFENATAKAKTLLENKNREKQSFSLSIIGGNNNLRAGTELIILSNNKKYVITIKKAIHSFQNGEHRIVLEAVI